MKLSPLHDFVLVKRLEPEHQTVSGILIPDVAAELPDQGEVVAASSGIKLENGNLRSLDVRVGDKVLFGKNAGQAVKIDGKDFLVMREDDLIAVLED